jgi:hypothetical protein
MLPLLRTSCLVSQFFLFCIHVLLKHFSFFDTFTFKNMTFLFFKCITFLLLLFSLSDAGMFRVALKLALRRVSKQKVALGKRSYLYVNNSVNFSLVPTGECGGPLQPRSRLCRTTPATVHCFTQLSPKGYVEGVEKVGNKKWSKNQHK